MMMQFAKLPMAAFALADKVDRNRYKLRPETARGAVADLYVMAAKSMDGSVSYNPRYWAIRWEWNNNEVSRLLKKLITNGFFVLKKCPDGSHAIIPRKNNVTRTVAKTAEECNQKFSEESGQGGKVVRIKKIECNQDVTEYLDKTIKEKKYSFSETIFATSKGKRKRLSAQMTAWFMELYSAYGDKRGRAEAAWEFTEIPDLSRTL